MTIILFMAYPLFLNFPCIIRRHLDHGQGRDDMVDAVAVWGNESRVTEGLQGLLSMGATEILASPVSAGSDREASRDRTLEVLSKVGQSLPE